MSEIIVQKKPIHQEKAKWSTPEKYIPPAGGSLDGYFADSFKIPLGQVTKVLRHNLSPHEADVWENVPGPRENTDFIKSIKPDGGQQTYYEVDGGDGYIYRIYHKKGRAT